MSHYDTSRKGMKFTSDKNLHHVCSAPITDNDAKYSKCSIKLQLQNFFVAVTHSSI